MCADVCRAATTTRWYIRGLITVCLNTHMSPPAPMQPVQPMPIAIAEMMRVVWVEPHVPAPGALPLVPSTPKPVGVYVPFKPKPQTDLGVVWA